MSFSKVLVANRGEIACRVIRTLKKLGIQSVAVYSEADREAPHVTLADEAYLIGPAAVSESYLRFEKIIAVAKQTGAQGIHPGYGLLSENAGFAEACEAAGIEFIGPTPRQLRVFGLKHSAREQAVTCGVPLVPGTDLLKSEEEALSEAARIGYPVMLKSTAGGGGIGMRRCDDADALSAAFASVVRQGTASFGDGGVFLEKFVVNARHIEVQMFGDGKGRVLALGERDCSTQRRNQKVIEETPAPNITEEMRQRLWSAAVKLCESVSYRSAGTVEFVYDADVDDFYFLEVNTRLQVEHTVTEEVTGLDLVGWMVRLAGGEDLALESVEVKRNGWAMQARVYAEDPNKDFQPSSGVLTHVAFPDGVRCDGWIASGTEVTPYYDPLLAKVIVHAASREEALAAMSAALQGTTLAGIETNLEYLRQILKDELFVSGKMTTRALGGFVYRPRTFDVLASGTMTTVQDYPGRVGYWEVGVPPSGAMDPLALRVGNRLLGNSERSAGLEMTMSGPTLRFNVDTWVCLTGALMASTVDGAALEFWRPVKVKTGQILKIGQAKGTGCRAYLAMAGGIDVPDYLGSKSTFTLGGFGGHAGRALRVGDVVPFGESGEVMVDASVTAPSYSHEWEIGVLYGPHGAPEFFKEEDMEMFFSQAWEVHFNSARTGVRLVGPKPKWARSDGGEAGLHPSNIHDNAYAIGAVDFTGDMPIILGPDGPSLGGFVCPVVVVQAELWKLGQLRPGDTVKFVPVAVETAREMELAQESAIEKLTSLDLELLPLAEIPKKSAVLFMLPAKDDQPDVVFRPAGDHYLLVEFGPLELDIFLRFWVHAVYLKLKELGLEGVVDLTPGIRSLQIHFDARLQSHESMMKAVVEICETLPAVADMEVPARVVHLPLSWDDPSTREAIQKYMDSVRADAPWCPSNIEFIRRINGLESVDEVMRMVFEASYLVLGLGDVYLGAPVATPMDPRHRLVTTKYNPARTWTPQNAVGIGGAYMCVYGMEGPGGYQFVGRTVQMWNRYQVTESFIEGQPWLLRFFDQVRFYPVTAEELVQLRIDFPQGRFVPKIEETRFKLGDYEAFLEKESESIEAFRNKQQKAFGEERQRWEEAGINVAATIEEVVIANDEVALADNELAVQSEVAGNLWKLNVGVGDQVEAGQTVAIVEAMKMEIHVNSPVTGKVTRVTGREGQSVSPGQTMVVIAS
ncbi:urea carboxylase [Phragmitibacter flavus]|uniref:Urea carboxylase n=1 Tax=Phragmitibacter flavus TaxID=2576071 RepID=A0A5R8KDG8_9BACT|nr:urea carboxylase [Phragmitibacter flavus]TLD69975.1 urea carboxylase [Phragmitibacter flavus]